MDLVKGAEAPSRAPSCEHSLSLCGSCLVLQLRSEGRSPVQLEKGNWFELGARFPCRGADPPALHRGLPGVDVPGTSPASGPGAQPGQWPAHHGLHQTRQRLPGRQHLHGTWWAAAAGGVTLFLQASPHRDISRRTASFQYELLSNQSTAGPDFKKMALFEAMCRPCDNMELLMAICSSDFVVKGSIRNVSHDSENRMSQVDVRVQKVYRQKNRIFQQEEGSGEWRGPIQTLLQCKVKKGGGDFLFTGNEHFGEAWLGCAPRFKDFMLVYQAARERGANPCEFELN
ncbi:meteorin-like protein isoform X2 [Parus major]|uniref:meteorin-like protein isoform X2 n=1 Tax=Parus major TaxID=9157 RepID=UPI0007710127|nr:meteorin-like protein isoform X2 [Parus major]